MDDSVNRGAGHMWSLRGLVAIRLILYLVVVAFIVQRMYFGGGDGLFRPGKVVAVVCSVFVFNLALIPIGRTTRRINALIILSFLLDLAVITLVVLASGGFSSPFVPYYLVVLALGPAWLPRRFTAVFPSVATLGVAIIGTAHLINASNLGIDTKSLIPIDLAASLKEDPAVVIVANMLILAVLFFIVSYLSGVISDKLLSEQKLNSAVLAAMEEGVAVLGSNREIVYANAGFTRIFPEAEGASLFAGALADAVLHSTGEKTMLDRLFGGGGESILISRDGETSPPRPPVEIRATGISPRAADGVSGVLLLVTDLTLRQRMEKAERNLERFSAISTMAAGLAHEIRNPLASMRGAIQEIGDAFPAGSQNRVLADIVMSESDRLDGVIGRFLDFSREGKLHLNKRRLGGILREAATMIQRGGKPLEAPVIVQDDPEVVCDPDRIKEVVLNLALNAAREIPATGGRIEFHLGLSRDRIMPGVEISVADNGPGIAPEARERLFEPFFTQREGGTGMGLAISRKQVDLHGGDIKAGNRPEGGAVFTVWLPLKADADAIPVGRRMSHRTVIYRAGKQLS